MLISLTSRSAKLKIGIFFFPIEYIQEYFYTQNVFFVVWLEEK